jgi:hypothetical protein
MKFSPKYLFAIYIFALPRIATDSRVEPIITGTVVFVDVAKDEIVIAADSRGNPEGTGSYDDRDCKLMASKNDAIFASYGMRYVPMKVSTGERGVWDSQDEARKAFDSARSAEDSRQSLAHVAANNWADAGKKFWEMGLAAGNFAQMAGQHGNHLSNGIFASVEKNGGLRAFYVEISLARAKDGITNEIIAPVKPIVGQQSFANDKIIREFISIHPSPRAKEDIRVWKASLPSGLTPTEYRERWAVRLIEWAIQLRGNDQSVGGDANAIALDKAGVRWPKTHDYCEAAK